MSDVTTLVAELTVAENETRACRDTDWSKLFARAAAALAAATKRAETAEAKAYELETDLMAYAGCVFDLERQLTEAQAEAAGLRDALKAIIDLKDAGHPQGLSLDAAMAYRQAERDADSAARQALSATGPSPYAELVRLSRVIARGHPMLGDRPIKATEWNEFYAAVSALNPKAGEG
ncbi:MAG: hypothetical protein GEU78_18510 [Actinobacteria bacterium]|nr:hypothetical protein [Actinomycetota bacterium]